MRLSAGRRGLALVVVAALAATVPALAGADGGKQASPQAKVVDVRDDFYAPDLLRIRKGVRVRWDWGKDASVSSNHDVFLLRGPSGVKKPRFRSEVASAPYKFARTFRVPGIYKFLCTNHSAEMRMQVRVRR